VVGGPVVGGAVVGGAVVGRMVVGGVVVGGVVVESVTITSSKDAVAWNVCRETRPALIELLLPDAIWVPSTKPVIVVPDTSMRRV